MVLRLKDKFIELGKKRMSEAGAKHGELYKDLGSLVQNTPTFQDTEPFETNKELAERAQTSRATMAKIEYVSKLGENQDTKAERQLELSC